MPKKLKGAHNTVGDRLSLPSKAVDPALAALFESSLLKSVEPVPYSPKALRRSSHDEDAEEFSSEGNCNTLDPRPATDESQGLKSPQIKDLDAIEVNDQASPVSSGLETSKSRKRKRKRKIEDDIEGRYMQRLAKEESQEAASRHQSKIEQRKKLEPDMQTTDGETVSSDHDQRSPISTRSPSPVPQHETVAPSSAASSELEKASRTVFLGNVSTVAIKSKSANRLFLDHLSSFLSTLPSHNPPHKIISLRFRSTPYSSSSVPKKAAFARKELMDATSRSTNAYAVYSTALGAREAAKRLNGTIVLERHLRVDSVAHPAKTDHRRCVFVGNLGFVDDDSAIKAAEDEESGEKASKKTKEPADVEEGLWRVFGKAGEVESVRVVRDKITRVGKGFAYVQFKDGNAVEKALLYDSKKYPPLLPRILRVTRAKNIQKTASYTMNGNNHKMRRSNKNQTDGGYVAKPSSQVQSLSGRAAKLLGRAGAAQLRQVDQAKGNGKHGVNNRLGGTVKTPEAIVFEGYRASKGHGQGTLKLKGSGGSSKKSGKPKTRSSKRGAAYKALGEKKRKA